MERYRFYNDCALYYVTFSVVDWLPVFVSDAAFRIVIDSLNFCRETKSLRTNAYVIMPTHLHAIVFDAEWKPARLEDTLTDFRKFTGRKLADYCEENEEETFGQAFRRGRETRAEQAPQ